ncbi:hypothetical protein [Streptomyces chartreusis]|uniref:hypothetical protein n=1 Tax=Streptomyces chartreusis TaxID=1969 RepID=UPI002F919400|nr:hypothetical protein OG938_47535 [Streptomyces chartreusis]WTA33690.1 hypothetical protein OIA45_48115 [Streptomyces chartreusis]
MASVSSRRRAAIVRARRRTACLNRPVLREDAVVGRTEGATYAIWHIQATPADPLARNRLLEQLGLDAEEDWGGVHAVYATSPAGAAARVHAEQAHLSGLD